MYYVLFNDTKQRCTPNFISGIYDINPSYKQEKAPRVSKYTFPYDFQRKEELKAIDTLYLNFYKDFTKSFLDTDYRIDHGHIFSLRFFKLLKNFRGSEYLQKELIITKKGELLENPFVYLDFTQRPPFDFINIDNSQVLKHKEYEDIFPQTIALHKKAENYDIFPFGNTNMRRFLVVNKKLKEAIEKEKFKGFKFIPLDEFPKTFASKYNFDLKEYRE